MHPILETERLLLLPWKLEYAQDMLFFASNENVVNASDGWKIIDTAKKAASKIQKFVDNVKEDKWEWAIALKTNDSHKIIGSIGGFKNTSNALGYDFDFHFGYLIAEEYWGQGLCTEAAQRLIHYAFMELKCDIVTANHRVSNIRSKRVIEKCKLNLRGIFPKKSPEAPNSKACYVLTRNDYMEK